MSQRTSRAYGTRRDPAGSPPPDPQSRSADLSLEHPLIRKPGPADLAQIRDFLLESSGLYPDIERWWSTKVQSAAAGKRVVLVVDLADRIEGLFIGKPGISAKVCALRLRNRVRNHGIGRSLITEGLERLVGRNTARLHVTISEAAEDGSLAFFESIGFSRMAVARDRYQRGVDEFVYGGPVEAVLDTLRGNLAQGVERMLFGTMPRTLPHENTILMSVRPEFAESMMQRRKTVEFRRMFSTKHVGARVVFYVTHPVRMFLLTATIAGIDHRPKRQLWSEHRERGGISRDSFDYYFAGTENGYAIELEDLRPVPNQLCLKEAQRLCPTLRPPRSFQSLAPTSPLLRALDLPVNI